MDPRTRRLARATAAGALVAGTLGLAGSGAQAGLIDADEAFEYTGGAQRFIVPADVCSIDVDLLGASGNAGGLFEETGAFGRAVAGIEPVEDVAAGGLGGRTRATLEVTPGETLEVYVGGQGGVDGGNISAGGFNGGGDGGNAEEDPGGGGGGATDIRRAPYGLSERLAVAGGGGGGGGDDETPLGGDGGGSVGLDGLAPDGEDTPPGLGGTQTAGGAAPTSFDPSATDGALGQGGDGGVGTDNNDGGGGGGGGWYGGGGGAGDDEESDDGAGGGGGSGYGPAGTTFETGVVVGDGSAFISYTPEPGCDTPPTTPSSTTTTAAVQATVTPRFTG